MEPESPHTGLVELARQRQPARHCRQVPVEAGVEAGHLRYARMAAKSHLDAREHRRKMNRREMHDLAERGHHLRRNPLRPVQLRTSMNEAMHDRVRSAGGGRLVERTLDRVLVVAFDLDGPSRDPR